MLNHIALQYAGSQSFSDHNHVKNFIKYLASTSRGHQNNSLTKNNFMAEFAQNATKSGGKAFYNLDPKANTKRLQAFVLHDGVAAGSLSNDLAYASFIVRSSDGWVSNFMSGSLDRMVAHDSNLFDLIVGVRFGGSEGEFSRFLSSSLRGGEVVTAYQQASPTQRLEADKAILKEMQASHPAETLISVIHNDQESPCHIHRIVRR